MGSQRMLAGNALSDMDARTLDGIFSSHEPGWWWGKAFSEDFRKESEKDLRRAFSRPLACNIPRRQESVGLDGVAL
jgi:hypothetical protein